jgi:tetratricopeptide (TPR) repeat protein
MMPLEFGKRLPVWFPVLSLLLLLANSKLIGQESDVALSDTVFRKFKLEDVQAIRDRYNRVRERAANKLERIDNSAMAVDTSISERRDDTIVGQDAVLLRLAEFKYEEAQDVYFAQGEAYERAYERYDSLLAAYDRGEISTMPEQPALPKYDYSESIRIYRRIADDYANGIYADEALYNIAFLYAQMGEGSTSRRIFQELIDKYPDSEYAAEAFLNLADYFFSPREGKSVDESVVELEKAIKLYKNILKYPDSRSFNEALYKLGWSYYKLTARDSAYFKDAIWYFWRAVEDVHLGRELDSGGRITSTIDIEPEAIKYLAICYSDLRFTGRGVLNARQFIENYEAKLGERPYSMKILRDLGDVYFDREDRDNAIFAYENLLDMYPLYEDAPAISQKIISTHVQDGRDEAAYAERERLYLNYNPNSEWYKTIEASELAGKYEKLKQAYRLSEEAMRSNIAFDYIQAEDQFAQNENGVGQGYYTKVVGEINDYLEIFPIDTNAYELNWQLAQILDYRERQLEAAFDEYLKVCNDYYEEDHQEEAAKNAISIAQDLATGQAVTDTLSGEARNFEVAELQAQELNEDQQRLIYAYDNYLRHFPEGDYAPTALASAGALYFNNNQFNQAKVYLQTLVRKFPGAEERNLANKAIMESYFALGKFRDAEIVANRIIATPGVSEEMLADAKARAAASIFKNGEKLARDGMHMEAGEEFKRLTQTYPESRFADNALIKSANAFEEAGAWALAITSYELLIQSYPKSTFYKDAHINIAEDYRELDDNRMVGVSYEKAYNTFPDDELAESWLYNSSLYFEKAEAWQDAIRVNNTYVAAYPTSPDANVLLFNNAGFFLKLGMLLEANQIYDEYAVKYPDSPRTVEAFFRRGEYYEDSDANDLAVAEYRKAVSKSDELKSKGKDPNAYWAGESVYRLVEIRREEFDNIKLSLVNYESARQQKLDMLKTLSKDYEKVISYGSVRGFESFYRIPEMYEQIGNDIKNQELPFDMPEDQQLVKRKENRAAAAQLYNKAVEEYRNVLSLIPDYGDRLGVNIFAADTISSVDAVIADTGFAMLDSSALELAALEDSTRIVGRKWYSRTEGKVSLLLYDMAEAYTENMGELSDAGYAQANATVTGSLNIFYKAKILSDGVIPDAQRAIAAHEQNVQVAEELNLENKYVEESKRQILLVSNFSAEKYTELFDEALQGHFANEAKVKEIAEYANEATADASGLTIYDYMEESQKYIDYAKFLGEQAFNRYVSTLELAAADSIRNDYLRTTENKMFQFAYQYGIDTYNLSAQYDSLSKHYLARFDSSDFNYTLEEVGIYFEDVRYAMDDIFRLLLETGYATSLDYTISNIWTKRILAQLVLIDPATYAAQIPKEEMIIQSDTSFVASYDYTEGWPGLAFDDSQWSATVFERLNEDSISVPLFADLGINPKPIWLQPMDPEMRELIVADTVYKQAEANIDTSAMTDEAPPPVLAETTVDSTDSADVFLSQMLNTIDSSAVNEDLPGEASTDTLAYTINYRTEYIPVAVDTADTLGGHFRYSFEMPGKVTSGIIYVTADDDLQLFINGEYILDDIDNNYALADSIPLYVFEDFLVEGTNVIGIKVTDLDPAPRLGLRFYLRFKYIPASLQDELTREEEVPEVVVNPERLHKVMLVNKGRLIPKQ